VKHYHIRKTDAGQFFVSDSHPFDTLAELVVYHKREAGGRCSFVAIENYNGAGCYMTNVIISLPMSC